MNNQKTIIVDGHNLAYRIYYGTRERDPMQLAHKFIDNIKQIIAKYDMTHLAVCFDAYSHLSTDAPKPTSWRKKMYPGYKANRSKMPEELDMALLIISRSLETSRVPYFTAQEADDAIGSLATQVRAISPKEEIIIYSNDADMHQLIQPLTHILYRDPLKAMYLFLHDDNYQDKFGITPTQTAHVKALAGDSSDSIPGVPGVGKRTAIKLIQQFGDIDTMYADIDEAKDVTKSRLQAIIYHNDDVYDYLAIVTINTNMKYEFDFDTWSINRHNLHVVNNEVDKPVPLDDPDHPDLSQLGLFKVDDTGVNRISNYSGGA